MSRKKSPLEKILKIDKDIDRIKKDTTYLRIRKGLKTMDDFQGKSFILIPSPHDVGKELRLRRRSKELKSVKTAYKVCISEFEAEINLLRKEKAALEVQIFG
jgi:hypothetical protein